ncbi:MAG TPA: hypothetical protein VNA69_19995 [Thermoanaerobaculia bacterium]|nr:hypothetical protein [Thermoanaerobaculia bacterium]
MTDLRAEELLHALTDATMHESRREFSRVCASCLQASGDVLWAFGLAEEPQRRAVALVLQISGRLAHGAISLLESENWYAAGALVRQLIEAEYLLFRFNADEIEAEKWLSATAREIRDLFSPGAMRKRSGQQFRVEEYAVHCERGGHPNPRAGFLLPEHAIVPDHLPFGSLNWLWVDLAQHLARIGVLMSTLVQSHFAYVGIARQSAREMRAAIDQWECRDLWAAVQFSSPAGRQTGNSGGSKPAAG